MSVAPPTGHKLRCEFTASEGVGAFIFWVLLSVVTLGLALFVAPYYIFKEPINRTSLIGPNGDVVGKLHVEVDLSSVAGHAVIWGLLILITGGLALMVYPFSVLKHLLNGVEIK